MANAGAGEIVIDKALSAEAAEEALDDAVFEMEMDAGIVNEFGGFEDDGLDRASSAPVLPGFVIFGARRTEGIERVSPGGGIYIGEDPALGVGVVNGFEGGRVIEFEAEGERVLEVGFVEADEAVGFFKLVFEFCEFRIKVFATFADGFLFFFDAFALFGFGSDFGDECGGI